MNSRTSTYVYCVVVAPRAPRTTHVPPGLAGTGRPRALEIAPGLFAIVADAPSQRYSEAAINRRLSDLKWVSRAAVAHEAVVEHFIDARAVLPMKLFTMFADDERARAYLRAERARLAATAKRVSGHLEWGIRVLLDRTRAAEPDVPARGNGSAPSSGAAFLARKKARRDAGLELATRGRQTASALYEQLAAKARASRKRTGSDLPPPAHALLLDAAFLVPRSRSASFRSYAVEQARRLEPKGYAVTLTGPWPPYSFVQ